jgi:hypothetical protein
MLLSKVWRNNCQPTFSLKYTNPIVNVTKIKSIEGNILDIGNEKITISQSLREKVINEIVKDKMIKR